MNIKCQFIRPRSLSNLNHCQPIINCCKCKYYTECLCNSNILSPKSALAQNSCCDGFPNKITYELTSKKIFNPVSFFSNNPRFNSLLSRNDSITEKMGFRTTSEKKNNNHCQKKIIDIPKKDNNNFNKRKSLIQGISNRIDNPVSMYTNKNLENKINSNFSNYMNSKRKRNQEKNVNYRQKIRNLGENINGMYNDLLYKKNNNKRDKNGKRINKKICNSLIGLRRQTLSSANQSKREDSKDQILIDDNNDNGNDKKYNSDTMAKIIIDKEIKNKNLEDEINKYKVDYNSLKNEFQKLYKENEDIKKINNDIKNKYNKYKSNLLLLKKRNEEDKEKYQELETDNNKLKNKIKNINAEENNFKLLNNENFELKNENETLRNKIKTIQKDYKNIMTLNDECKTNFDSMLSKYNDLLKNKNDLEKENRKLKNKLMKMKTNYDKLSDEYADSNNQLN